MSCGMHAVCQSGREYACASPKIEDINNVLPMLIGYASLQKAPRARQCVQRPVTMHAFTRIQSMPPSDPKPQLADLRALMALIREGTVTRAAMQLGVTQSTLSYQLDATSAAGVVTSTTRVVTYTITGGV